MEKQALKPIFLTGKDMLQFLEEDDALNKSADDGSGLCREVMLLRRRCHAPRSRGIQYSGRA